ncbi:MULTISPECIES: hypothetical protein [unclassified Methylobacterium]|jgi:hypothetical protein|uniref:hypothetical protein n=1 Tax=unclassified Methylobacterium TaxID=2615210 RepID=UPI0006FDAEFB|nr:MULTISPECIES: hypothetical protein [unclassified Methylobacterium]KQO45649.1 hypothetical protein ASF24_10765 [Methylobacterium sp. Leaf86]KQO97954.1 hypothetical protein ASF32_16075 [Methylobacterium sp. Leaf91]MBO1021530.1 hypothetical protein [Methylobacterium sp. SD274]
MRKEPLIRASLLLAAGIFLVQTAPAQAISDRRDQPTAADVPSETRSGETSGSKPIGDVKPPSAIRPTTAVTEDDGKSSRTNPLDHLPARDRAGTGGRRE